MAKKILDKILEEGPAVMDVAFNLIEATMKQGTRRMSFEIGTTLKKTDRFYRITLYFNENPWKDRIEANLRLIAEIKTDVTLFDKTKEGDTGKKEKISKINEEIKKAKEEMSNLKERCVEFNFTGEAEKVEYNKDKLTLKIDKDTLSFLNNQFELFSFYKMILKPII